MRSTEQATLRRAIECLQSFVDAYNESALAAASREVALLWRSIDSLVLRLVALEHAGRLSAGMLSTADVWALDDLAHLMPQHGELIRSLNKQIGSALNSDPTS